VAKFLEGKKVLITGGNGFLGSHVVREMETGKYGLPASISIPRSYDMDLRKREKCIAAVKGIDVAIHLAANGGGIGYNLAHPGQLFYDNAIMGIQLVECARLYGVEKLVIIGTVCAYPKFTHVPFREDDLWEGYPEETNAPYGLAKKMLLVQSQAYRQEYNFNSIYLLPVNLYGIGDDFSPYTSHVIPALIKKFADAKESDKKYIDVWGAGGVTREFIYAEDAARAILLATERYNKPLPVNIGSGVDITIKNLAEKIQSLVGFEGYIKWDMSKPEGQPARKLDITRAKQEFGFEAKVSFDEGLRKTVEWYMKKEG
jgi:GDP-L-fucose synthase